MRWFLAGLVALACTAAAGRPSAWGRNVTPAALLPVDEAFQLLPPERRGKAVHLEWNVAPGYYLYRGQLVVEVLSPPGARAGKLRLPPGLPYQDEHFGKVEIYRGLLQADYVLPGRVAAPVRLRVQYQGCADLGVCYPPQTREVEAGPSP